jgi:hypothetical protein
LAVAFLRVSRQRVEDAQDIAAGVVGVVQFLQFETLAGCGEVLQPPAILVPREVGVGRIKCSRAACQGRDASRRIVLVRRPATLFSNQVYNF